METKLRKFKDLPLGTRFKYTEDGACWVILDKSKYGLIAAWTGNFADITTQNICSAVAELYELQELEVFVVD